MRTLLYTPANTPSMMIQAQVYGADAVIFDLEDAIAPDKKLEARILLAQMFEEWDFETTELIVRINGLDTPWWKEDLIALMGKRAFTVRVPMIETLEQVTLLDRFLNDLETERDMVVGSTRIHILIETPKGVVNAYSLAGASKRITALGFGAEDYCRATGIIRKGPPYTLDYVRSSLVNAAASYGLECHDCAWGFLEDRTGLEEEARRSRSLGFCGKSVIHPDQIEIVNRVFSPTEDEINWAERILSSLSGDVHTVSGQMIDAPVEAQARRILELHSIYTKQEE